jgi:hypothetical protein
MPTNDHHVKPNPLEAFQALLRRRHSLHVITPARERVLDPAASEWIGFHNEDGHWFWALLIVRHWIHAPNLEITVVTARPTIEYFHNLDATVADEECTGHRFVTVARLTLDFHPHYLNHPGFPTGMR